MKKNIFILFALLASFLPVHAELAREFTPCRA